MKWLFRTIIFSTVLTFALFVILVTFFMAAGATPEFTREIAKLFSSWCWLSIFVYCTISKLKEETE